MKKPFIKGNILTLVTACVTHRGGEQVRPKFWFLGEAFLQRLCRYLLITVITLKLQSRSVVKERHITKQQREYVINILQNLQTPPIGLIGLFSGNAAVVPSLRL